MYNKGDNLTPRNVNSISGKIQRLKTGMGLAVFEKEEIEKVVAAGRELFTDLENLDDSGDSVEFFGFDEEADRSRPADDEADDDDDDGGDDLNGDGGSVVDFAVEAADEGGEIVVIEADDVVVVDGVETGEEEVEVVVQNAGADGMEVVEIVDAEVVEIADEPENDRTVHVMAELDVEPRVVIDRIDTWKGKDGTIRVVTEEEKEVLALMREVYGAGTWKEVPNLRAMDRRKVTREADMVEGLFHNLEAEGLSEGNRLLYTGSAVVARRLGFKVGHGKKVEVKKPRWQRRIETNIGEWRKALSQVEEIRKGTVVRNELRKELDRRYQLTERGAATVSTFLKNKIRAGSTKIRWFVEKKVARRQNNLFRNNQSQLYKELGGDGLGNTNENPDATESLEFWKKIWSAETEHDKDASWLDDVKERMAGVPAMEDVAISLEDVKAGIRRMTNWKAPGPDGVRGFWFKKFSSLHQAITDGLQEVIAGGVVPAWMVKGRTVLIQKDRAKGKVVSNYRPIACLPLMWKLLTGILSDKIYDHLQMNNILPDEQKGCRRRSRGTKDQLLIDKAILKEAKATKKALAMAWVDYRKAYDMLPHSWILESLGLIKVAKNIDGLLRGSMGDWKTVLTSNGETLGEVKIRRGIFQGDSLSPLLFIVAMIPLTMLLKRETNLGYAFGREKKRLNHLLFMDDLKLYAQNEVGIKKLLGLVQTFSTDIGMEFGLDKCAALVMEKGVKVKCKGIDLPDGQMIKEVDDGGYKYLGVLEGADIKTKQMKGMIRNEYLRRVRLVARSKLYAGNVIKAVNAWAISVVRYTAGVLDWTKKELKDLDTKTRKILTMNHTFHMRSSVDRLYMKRKDGGRGLISVKQCVRSEEIGLCEYVMGSEEWMLRVVAENMVVIESKDEYGKRLEKERLGRLMKKPLHGKFFNAVKNVADARSWQWLRGGFLDKKNEGYVCAAQENVLKTRLYERTVMKKGEVDVMCRKCGKSPESVGHLVSGCSVLAQTEYRRRHDRMGLRVYWELCGKYGVARHERWYDETPDTIRKSGDGRFEIWWDNTVVTPTHMEHNRPDVVVIDHVLKKWVLVDFSVPFDANVLKKEDDKIRIYAKLSTEINKLHRVQSCVIPIVVGALGVVSKRLAGYVERLGISDVIGGLQTTAVIGTAAILRKVLISTNV